MTLWAPANANARLLSVILSDEVEGELDTILEEAGLPPHLFVVVDLGRARLGPDDEDEA